MFQTGSLPGSELTGSTTPPCHTPSSHTALSLPASSHPGQVSSHPGQMSHPGLGHHPGQSYHADKFVHGGADCVSPGFPEDRNHNQVGGPGVCGRPGCGRPVTKACDGTASTYCSSECVVGQCREVYSSWAGGPQQQQQQQQQQQVAAQPQVK